ncbi:MAG: ATP-binding protein [Chlamydiia bacterium]|nr:ATP-binding protein [Chlamydiia bacterium]
MQRPHFLQKIQQAFKSHPIVAIIGPRQCGKTTLARMFADQTNDHSPENYFDLEDLHDLQRLEVPQTTLSILKGLIVIDEIQRKPDLFQTLRVLCDNPKLHQKFLILGSASQDLLKQSSESLTGRIIYLELTPFKYEEVHDLGGLWMKGGFPRSFLADDFETSTAWRKSYIRTFIEQDIPNLGFKFPPEHLRRFWMMLTHYHGCLYNASEIGRSLNIPARKIREYTDILTSTLMIRQLQPWHENISKRQVKTPKIYFRDSGLFHTLLGIADESALLTHPKLGASWEGFALEEVIRSLEIDPYDCFFWATQAHAELDLLIFKEGKRLGFEFKYSDSPKVTKSMLIAVSDLKLDGLVVVYPGTKSFKLHENIHAAGLVTFLEE